jgi:Flp pilus assembly protein protease CpaA
MNFLSIDALIVYGFLLLTLLVGLWAGRGIKDIREYAIKNKMYATGVFTMTMLATYFVAGIIRLKTDARSPFLAPLVTLITFFKLYFSKYLLIPLLILTNGISFFVAHLIINRGFILAKQQNS